MSLPWADLWLTPFLEFGFMQRALLGGVALSLSAAPVGVFLMLRRMSLMGDAMAHAILPGAAIGYLAAGLSLSAMTMGGIAAGLAVAVGSGWVARHTVLREDTSLAAFYLLSLALGVLIVSTRGNSVDLLHVLFGTVLALDDDALVLLSGITFTTLTALAVLYRPLVLECLDPGFLRGQSRWSAAAHYGFMALLVINLVAGFHALGTLMAVGVMVLPAATARFWVRRIGPLLALAPSACGASGANTTTPAAAAATVATSRRRHLQVASNGAHCRLQTVNAGLVVGQRALDLVEFQYGAPGRARPKPPLVHRPGYRRVEQVLHHLVAVLGVMTVLLGSKIPEDSQLLERCIQEEPVDPTHVVLEVPQVRRKDPNLVDLLEDHLEKLGDQHPASGRDLLVMRWCPPRLAQDLLIVVSDLGDEDGTEVHDKLAV